MPSTATTSPKRLTTPSRRRARGGASRTPSGSAGLSTATSPRERGAGRAGRFQRLGQVARVCGTICERVSHVNARPCDFRLERRSGRGIGAQRVLASESCPAAACARSRGHVPHRGARRRPRRALFGAGDLPVPSRRGAPARSSSWPGRTSSGSSRSWSARRSSVPRCPDAANLVGDGGGRRRRGRAWRRCTGACRSAAWGSSPRWPAPDRWPCRCWPALVLGAPISTAPAGGRRVRRRWPPRRPAARPPMRSAAGRSALPGWRRSPSGAWYVLIDRSAELGDPLWALVVQPLRLRAIAAVVVAVRGFDRPSVPPRHHRGRRTVRRRGQRPLRRGARDDAPWPGCGARRVYPIVTMLLARFLLGERLTRLGQAGVALAGLGIVLISLGG